MIKLDYSKAKSAEILGITEGAVKRGRQRLSKKLGLVDVRQFKGFVEGELGGLVLIHFLIRSLCSL